MRMHDSNQRKARKKMNDNEKNELSEIASTYIARDYDASEFKYEFMEAFNELLDFCDAGYGEKPTYHDNEYNFDKPVSDLLIQEYISFASGIGGSVSDYAANAIIDGLDSIDAYLIPVDIDDIMDVLSGPITQSAIYPEREFGRLSDAGICKD